MLRIACVNSQVTDYSVSLVSGEYIVQFRAWYSQQAREGYISSALHHLQPALWRVLPR